MRHCHLIVLSHKFTQLCLSNVQIISLPSLEDLEVVSTSMFSFTRDLIAFEIRSSSSLRKEREGEEGRRGGGKKRGMDEGKRGGRKGGERKGGERKGTFRNTGSYSICKIYLHVFIHLFPEDSNAVILLLNISNLLLNLQYSNNATLSIISTTFT